ncbi:class I SAM-dependent methyltransferase [Actinacidiphila acidipaludis]|uniref:Class I SAM-dependent methyltransferase n=1 Tax=Actinacidiphila acidipaludis TaxID=2873382 RepID=A0ABS7Q2A0_9ACTN|nr:class I SAM-dependent methyltransferase [Streptomyces acidipaludis]MBY8876859.1 class I SAM-dependent methyltransferase [Streptomyces acidipaludis]
MSESPRSESRRTESPRTESLPAEAPREGHQGTGPGAITPDGCAVDLYVRLPVRNEPDVVQQAVPAGATLLELGSGAGRVTGPLAARGFAVTAVDESRAMLDRVEARVPGVRTVHSPIETLDLGEERFDAVLLASFLVHAPDPEKRQALLRACRRHVADGGCVLVQREGDGWHTGLPREASLGDGVSRVLSSEPVAPGVRSVHVEYVFPDARWTQTFLSRPLDAAEFTAALAGAGLALDTYLTEDGTWARALPV